MGVTNPDKDTQDVLDRLARLGWEYKSLDPKKSHTIGHLTCGGGCRLPVYGTPGGNQPREIWNRARRCSHGARPEKTFRLR